ncbi:hypothetical protein CYMTET_53182 [Cymbomonas tetramitiformis]|uniref:Sialidase domain-containing protein n=1 Tax=Cymbomonas tetramitiformis TaxID=36881 RepID=A0AAE0EQV3_9CHLO|nr:hypothetical protein CYMTET_53182 [Cymbomonas tetramitiformis]
MSAQLQVIAAQDVSTVARSSLLNMSAQLPGHAICTGNPQELVPGDVGGRGPVKNKPIVLQSGRWIAGGSQEGFSGSGEWRCFVDWSDDQGETWHRTDDLEAPEGIGVIQPTIWESSPGHVSMLMRSSKGKNAVIMRASSHDAGRSWGAVYRTHLPNNNAAVDVARLPYSGTLILAYNPVTENRTPLRLAVSMDNGKTWPLAYDVESEPGKSGIKGHPHEFSYPSIVPWPSLAVALNTTVRMLLHALFSCTLTVFAKRPARYTSESSGWALR